MHPFLSENGNQRGHMEDPGILHVIQTLVFVKQQVSSSNCHSYEPPATGSNKICPLWILPLTLVGRNQERYHGPYWETKQTAA